MTEQSLDHDTQPLPTPERIAAALAVRQVGADTPSDATLPLPPPPPKQHPIHRIPTAWVAVLAAGVLVAGVVLAVLVTRIGHEPAQAADAPQTFSSPHALVDYLERRGLPCSGYEAVSAPGKATERGRCTAGGQVVGVGVYPAHSDVEAQWSAEAGNPGPLFMALGENWTVDGPADWTKRVADALSAQYRAQP
ncbi:hypothetical protein ACQP00_36045 [Dactylosporangium sp. CS-047395]|uniref:hypothetical protein n=1 Tax=Dactylosporangium sp. CS-047395 TaxID=3239936 RepID=UPI003D8B8F60